MKTSEPTHSRSRSPQEKRSVPTEEAQSRTISASAEGLEQVIHAAVRQELRFFSGPLPPPEELVKYQVLPDCGKVIVEMAQKEQGHRHTLEDRQLDGGISRAKSGQLIGAVLAFALVLRVIYLLAHDKSTAGLTVLGAVVVAFGGA
jgi:uncharacterized membrane protein